MKDSEWITLRNRFLIGFSIFLVFAVLFLFFFINKFQVKTSPLISKINQKETFLLYIIESNCKSCKEKEKVLKKKNIAYEVLNKSHNFDYEDILILLDQENIEIPSIYYIVEGFVYSSMENPTEEELEEYIENILGGNV